MTPNAGRTPDRPSPQHIPEHGRGAWIPLVEAAQILGITYAAAQRGIARGTLAAEKRHGRWYVFVGDADAGPDPDPTPRPDATGPGPDALVTALQDEIRFLRATLDRQGEELRRRDHLLAAALERIPALPAGDSVQTQTTPPTAPISAPQSDVSDPVVSEDLSDPVVSEDLIDRLRRWIGP